MGNKIKNKNNLLIIDLKNNNNLFLNGKIKIEEFLEEGINSYK